MIKAKAAEGKSNHHKQTPKTTSMPKALSSICRRQEVVFNLICLRQPKARRFHNKSNQIHTEGKSYYAFVFGIDIIIAWYEDAKGIKDFIAFYEDAEGIVWNLRFQIQTMHSMKSSCLIWFAFGNRRQIKFIPKANHMPLLCLCKRLRHRQGRCISILRYYDQMPKARRAWLAWRWICQR